MVPTEPATSEHQHKVILVVNDDESMGTFVVTALSLEDSYRALLATNAAEALSFLDTLRPDACVLDYHLPGITGLELAERLHQMEEFQHLPIVMMSANAPSHLRERPDLTWLEKPFSLDELLAVVAHLFGA